MIPELVDLIKHEEGLRLTPYICPAGYPTIGYGHRIPSMVHSPITEEEAVCLLEMDIGLAEREALKLCANLADKPHRLAALTDLCFNVGRDALDGVDPNLLSDDAGVILALRREDWLDAAARFRRWNKAHVKGTLIALPGLTRRRELGARWIEEGP